MQRLLFQRPLAALSRAASTMKAARVHEFGKPLVIEEIPIPKINTNQVLVKMEACGVCHTDFHAAKGDFPIKSHLPFIPGHEGVGHVVEAGANVSNVKVGDRVGIVWLHSACGTCDMCLTAWETLCPNQLNSGFTIDGAFSEYAAADPKYLAKVPESADALQVAPILCAGLTVYKAIKQTNVRANEWIAISGVGGLGGFGIQYAKAMGMNVIGIGRSQGTLDAAKKLGADLVVSTKDDVGKIIQEKVGGVHGVVVTATSGAAFEQAQQVTRRNASIVIVGLPPEKFPLDIVMTALTGTKIIGSMVGTRKDMAEAMDFYSRGKVDSTESVASAKLEDVNEIFKLMEEHHLVGRKVIDFKL